MLKVTSKNFYIDDENELLNLWYKNDNYKVIKGLGQNKRCIVFCSSNGLYFPDTEETFREKIVCNDRYEWGHVASELIEHVEQIVFIRDVRKNFYVTGINQQVNTIGKVINLLKGVCKGYDIVTVGSSAGGYMATILGMLLGARYILNWGGQWNLLDYNKVVENYYFLNKYKNDVERNSFFDLSDHVQQNTVPIYYFYAARNESDIQQAKYTEDISNIYSFSLDSDVHGQGFHTEAYISLLRCETDDLKIIYSTYHNYLVSPEKLSDQINLLVSKSCTYAKANRSLQPTDKLRRYRDLLVNWIKWKQDGGEVDRNLIKGRIAVWGKGLYLDLLLREFNLATDNRIEVACIVESYPGEKDYNGTPVISIEDLPEEISLIVVIPYYDLKSIIQQIRTWNNEVEVVSIEHLFQPLNV